MKDIGFSGLSRQLLIAAAAVIFAACQGPTGPAGTNGDIGPQGPAGTKGDPGAQGSAGSAGATGATGAQGQAGVQGPAGTNGTAGTVGPTGDIVGKWMLSKHARTQDDPASELSTERAGQTPDDVINGTDAEDCIACHGPAAVTANGGMSEVEALTYFFTTTDGKFDSSTATQHEDEWPDVNCTACHAIPGKPGLALFDSKTATHKKMSSARKLCGQCHGSLHFADTDHLSYDAWLTSKHAKTQNDPASELSTERAGQTPDEVINGDDAEDCIQCHAPTAVLANGGMTEAGALAYFFTTTNGKFDSSTVAQHTDEWPNVSCTTCHDPHQPNHPSYFDSSKKEYIPMRSPQELCGQCHGNLRFPDTDHLSYNILTGTGGMGIDDQKTMPGSRCVDCHMYNSGVDGSNSAMFHGHSFKIIVKEADGATASCTQCHSSMDAAAAQTQIDTFKSDFATLDTATAAKVASAVTAMKGSTDVQLQNELAEAQFNLTYAESDESGGFHNHKYLMSLLNDANAKAEDILSKVNTQ